MKQYTVYDSEGRFQSVTVNAQSSFEARNIAAKDWGVDYLDLYAMPDTKTRRNSGKQGG